MDEQQEAEDVQEEEVTEVKVEETEGEEKEEKEKKEKEKKDEEAEEKEKEKEKPKAVVLRTCEQVEMPMGDTSDSSSGADHTGLRQRTTALVPWRQVLLRDDDEDGDSYASEYGEPQDEEAAASEEEEPDIYEVPAPPEPAGAPPPPPPAPIPRDEDSDQDGMPAGTVPDATDDPMGGTVSPNRRGGCTGTSS